MDESSEKWMNDWENEWNNVIFAYLSMDGRTDGRTDLINDVFSIKHLFFCLLLCLFEGPLSGMTCGVERDGEAGLVGRVVDGTKLSSSSQMMFDSIDCSIVNNLSGCRSKSFVRC